jgi:hypothetical protein
MQHQTTKVWKLWITFKKMEAMDKNHKKSRKMPCFWITAWKHYENELP